MAGPRSAEPEDELTRHSGVHRNGTVVCELDGELWPCRRVIEELDRLQRLLRDGQDAGPDRPERPVGGVPGLHQRRWILDHYRGELEALDRSCAVLLGVLASVGLACGAGLVAVLEFLGAGTSQLFLVGDLGGAVGGSSPPLFQRASATRTDTSSKTASPTPRSRQSQRRERVGSTSEWCRSSTSGRCSAPEWGSWPSPDFWQGSSSPLAGPQPPTRTPYFRNRCCSSLCSPDCLPRPLIEQLKVGFKAMVGSK